MKGIIFMNKVRFGVNYIPSKGWLRRRGPIDISATSQDLQAIRSLGCDHIRMHLMWDMIQPEPNRVDPVAIENLLRTLDLCQQNGLEACVTVFNGWMSGFIFKPTWAQEKNMFTSPEVLESEIYLLGVLGDAIGSHPALFGIDIGNELNVLAESEPFNSVEGDRWNNRIVDCATRCFPGKIIVNGVDHQSWFPTNYAFSRRVLANTASLTSLHTWIEFTGARKYGDESDHVMHLQDFMIELAKAYSADSARPVWVEEYGISPLWLPQDRHENFLRTAIQNALTCENLFGLTFWCSHDIDRALRGFEQKNGFRPFNPLEYDLGLFDTENNIKPNGIVLRDLIQQYRTGYCPEIKNTAIVIDDATFNGWRYGEKYIELVRDHVHPQFVLRENAINHDYLARRHITELVDL